MSIETTKLDAYAREHLTARFAQDKAAQTEVQILGQVAEKITERADVGSYLLVFETEAKARAMNPDSLKTIKTNIKAFLEFANGWRKGQENWTPEQIASETSKALGNAKSLQQLSKASRDSVKEAQGEKADSKTKASKPTVEDMTKKLSAMTNAFAEAGASKAEIISALQGLINLANASTTAKAKKPLPMTTNQTKKAA